MREYKTDTTALRVAMAEKNILTIEQLHDISGINSKTLGLVLAGNIQPSSKVMFAVADALDLSPQKAGEIFFAVKLT